MGIHGLHVYAHSRQGIRTRDPKNTAAGAKKQARQIKKLQLKSTASPPVPDVLPDASNICTLLIKLGDTIKKVC